MQAQIKEKIEELIRLANESEFGLESIFNLIGELKLFQAMLAAESSKASISWDVPQKIVAETVDFLVRQINSHCDSELICKIVKESVFNIKKMFLDSVDPFSLSFPFSLSKFKEGYVAKSIDEDLNLEFVEKLKSDILDLERAILKMESVESQVQDTTEVKRLFHTIKGESGLLNLTDVQLIAHESENALNQNVPNLVDKLLQVSDWLIQSQINLSPNEKNQIESATSAISRIFDAKSLVENKNKGDFSYIPDTASLVSLEDPEFLTDFINESREHLDKAENGLLALEQNDSDQDAIGTIFRAYHTIKGSAGMLNLEDIMHLAHSAESILDEVRQGKRRFDAMAADLVLAATDKLAVYLEKLEISVTKNLPFYKDQNALSLNQEIKDYLSGKKVTVKEDLVKETVKNPASLATTDSQKEAKSVKKTKETLKIDTEVLDKILDMIGELVISQSMVHKNFSDGNASPESIEKNLSQLAKITRELQELGMSLRMTSLRSTFEKMARLVRDVAKKTGKLVSFVMEGEDTELDRNVVDLVCDPLMHMIRNGVDHGIESNLEERVKQGKKPSGTIVLSAFYQGGNVHIQIKDDGKGLDREMIFKKAVEKGIINAQDELTDEETYGLIFMPGFSTAAQVTDISGRGVGMDVVKKNIESLHGRIVINSTKGQGSTFTIVLPLTLAIIDGMIIESSGQRYVIPTLSIRETITFSPNQIDRPMGSGESILLRDEVIPIYRLDQIFSSRSSVAPEGQGLMMILENAGHPVGLVIDEILGQQQIVIKNLGVIFQDTKGFSGAAIMSDGSVGLILDVPSLIAIAHGKKDQDCSLSLAV